MTLSPISRRAGVLSLAAAVLIVLSQVMRVVGSRLLGSDWATTPAYTVTYTIALLGMAALLLALTAIYTPRVSPHVQPRCGRQGEGNGQSIEGVCHGLQQAAPAYRRPGRP
jgi:hypothetical protein